MNEQLIPWHGRRYYSLDAYLKNTFGKKLYKLSLNGGMSCPNRDGTLSDKGCIFCSAGGSGDFAGGAGLPLEEQIAYEKQLVGKKFSGTEYIAYFQAYTNTYAPVERLEQLFGQVIDRDDIAVLSIATRPDCLEPEKIALIRRLAARKPVWVELGLQTIHPATASLINRCYPLSCYDEAAAHLKEAGAMVITHMILGLPGESREDILQTARYIGSSGADGIKLQLLHILQNTPLASLYEQGECTVMSEREYVSLVADIIAILPPQMVIHRLTGDGNPHELIAPRWSGDKRHVLNAINHELKVRKITQGQLFEK